MKDIVISIDDFTDSREVMTAKPKPFTLWLIYIILGLAGAFVLWASYSQMDEYVKVNGTVRPISETSSMKFPISGSVKSISVKDGQMVKAGDTLFEINVNTAKSQKVTEEAQLKEVQGQIQNTQILISCIKTERNQFDSTQKSQENYLSKYNDYLANVKATKIQYESNASDLTQAKQDAQRTVAAAEQSLESDREMLQNYKIFADSISSNKNKFISNQSSCAKKFASYQAKYTVYEQTLSSDQKKLDDARRSGKPQDTLDALQKGVQADTGNLETLKQDALADAQTAVDQLNSQINELDLTKTKAQDALNGSESKKTGEKAALEKLRLDALSQLDDNLTTLHSNEATLKNQIFDLDQTIGSAMVKANTDGKVSMLLPLREGDFAAAGNEALSIVPQNAGDQMVLYVPESDISHFRIGGQLKYQINSLPYNEYGDALGKVISISPDVISDKTSGKNYYIVKGKLDTESLKNEKGDTEAIQTGMNCQAKMIYGSKSILSWLLEKLNFINH